MASMESVGAFAIVPTNDLVATLSFWERLGFEPVGGDKHYVILFGWDSEVHVTQAGQGPWAVPVDHNDEIAARVDDLIIRPGGVLRHRDWGLYEFAVAAPDGLLVRIGWPSILVGAKS